MPSGDIRDRFTALIEARAPVGRPYAWLERESGIAMRSWQNAALRRQRPTAEMLEWVGRLWPEEAAWLLTGVRAAVGAAAGQTTDPLASKAPVRLLPLADAQTPEVAGDTRRLCFRLPNSLRERVQWLARRHGFTVPAWVSGLVQTAVLADPVLDQKSVIALESAIREVSAIGRNLNQIARALNLQPQEGERVKLSELKELGEAMRVLREECQAVIASSRRAWGIK